MTAFTVAIRIDLVTLFPAMADGFLQESVIGRAIEKGTIGFKAHDLRQYSKDKQRKVDDIPYGGGPGMLMTCQPLFDAVDALATPDCEVIYLCPDGEQLTNPLARELAQKSHLILISGHYEGIDQRFRHRVGVRVRRTTEVVMQVVELGNPGEARFEHLHVGLRRDRLEIVRRQPFDEAIHLLTPGPERIGLGAAPFREPRHGALKRVAVQIGQARNLAGGEVQLCGHDKACTVSGEIC